MFPDDMRRILVLAAQKVAESRANAGFWPRGGGKCSEIVMHKQKLKLVLISVLAFFMSFFKFYNHQSKYDSLPKILMGH